MAVRAVFFDLYETLITEFANGKRLSKRSYDYMYRLGLSEAEFKQEWRTRFERRMNGHFPDYHSVIRDILVSRSLPYPQEHVEFLYQSRVSEKKIPFNRISNEICRMLELLRKRGLKLGLISNCSEEEVISFGQSGLAPYFDDVIFSYQVGIAKPNEEIYRLACERLSVTPQDSLFIGDGGSDELRGARSAGLRPYHAYWYNTFIESEYEKIHQPLHVLDLIESSTEMESPEP
ncbi:HAD family hydrolase [Paenibacillus sp. ISL-20]|uniref:HAD family hydrolase n=1 Tax=Paenibacillus sp. ISL-20 TaxID=2819163 RepID=UPI001BE510E4|nr:HAD family hydrolase [Paenibacillus sp. ISL-20]MBT2764858.1 HAD family hydrolase [Paenibacillus sp. ISL-20]